MRILALDLAVNTGFAIGEAGCMPERVQAVRLRKYDESGWEIPARNMACFLRDLLVLERIALIAVEDFMNPAAQPSADVAIMQLTAHGAVEAIAGLYGLRVERVAVSSVRTHFCGQATAGGAKPRGRPATRQERAAVRAATKNMVLQRAIALGYLPRDCRDDNKADASALYDYASSVILRKPVQQPFKLFGAVA